MPRLAGPSKEGNAARHSSTSRSCSSRAACKRVTSRSRSTSAAWRAFAPSKPWTKPAEAVAVEEEIAVAATIVPVEAGELQAAKDAVTKLQQEHSEAMKTAELAFQAQMTEAMKQLGAVELRAAQAIDAATSSKLREGPCQKKRIGRAIRPLSAVPRGASRRLRSDFNFFSKLHPEKF